MINVTVRAKRELKKLLSQKADWSYARLRLMDRGKGILGLGIDIELPGDQVVEYQGVKVLNVSPELAKKVDGITIDVDNTLDGLEIVVD